jgi:DNA repair protein RadC
MEIGNEGHRTRLRERFSRCGLDGFHDHEVLEILLSYAIPRKDIKPLARELLARFGNLAAVLDAPSAALLQVPGIGMQASTLICLMPRVFERYQASRWCRNQTFDSTRVAVSYLSARLGTERSEKFCILALNSRNDLIEMEEIQRGSVNRTAVFPRLVAEASLRHRATAVILAHNHPGGDPNPSSADQQLTRRLKRVLNDLDIVVHDHIIIAGPQYYSFVEHGALE